LQTHENPKRGIEGGSVMFAGRRSNASRKTPTKTPSLLCVVAGFAMVAACSNQITYSRISATVPDGGATLPGSGGSGVDGAAGAGEGGGGAAGAGEGGADAGTGGAGTGGTTGSGGAIGTGGADAGTDTAIGTGGMIGVGGAGMGGMIGTGGMGTGGAGVGGMGMGGMGTGGGPVIDNAQFNFEASAQGWAAQGPWTGTGRMTAQRFAGMASIGATLTYTPASGSMTQELWISPAAGTGPVAGNVVTFHVFLPANADGIVAWVQPYIQDGSTQQVFTGSFADSTMLTFGGWNTITVSLPATTVSPIFKMAVQLFTSGTVAFTGNIYVDSISW
jgi:hypothetical protein